MKAFISSVIFVLALAVLAGFVLEDFFARPSDEAFAMDSVRVGEDGSIEHRNFSGGQSSEEE